MLRKVRVPDEIGLAPDFPRDAESRILSEVDGGLQGEVRFARGGENRGAERVFRARLKRRGRHQKGRFEPRDRGLRAGDGGFSFGNGSRLVENDVRDALKGFEGRRVFEKNPAQRPLPRTDHDGRGGGEPERTGTGDDEYRHGVREGGLEIRPERQPNKGGRKRDEDHDGNENARNPVRKSCDGGLGRGRFVDEPDDARKRRVFTHARRAHGHEPRDEVRRPRHGVSRAFRHGEAFARQGGFDDGARPSEHDAVDGNRHPGFDDDRFAREYVFARYRHFTPVAHHDCFAGREVDELFDGFGGLPLGTRLEGFADRNEGENHRTPFEIEVVGEMRRALGVPRPERNAHRNERPEAVKVRGARSHRNERIHVGRTLKERLESPEEKRAVEVRGPERQKHLKLRVRERPFGGREPGG